jgi:hydroxyacylglutathione hydrolase
MRIVPVRVLSDNFAFLLINEATARCAAVDPAEPAKLFAAAKDEGVTITTVLTTHNHMDHAGGNREMARVIAGLDIIGGARESVQACTRTVEDEESFELEGMQIRCMLCPGHTQGHIAYYVTDSSDQVGHGFVERY